MLLMTVLIGLSIVVALAHFIDARRPRANAAIEEERLYLTGATVKRASLGFNGLAADWYWMRSLQYVGRKIINLPANVQLDNLSQLDLKLLAPLLDTATTLDPEFLEPYQFAAVVLPLIDVTEAIRITKKGIEANPSSWRLYQHLGYLYWQQKDFKTAGEVFGKGAQLPGAPAWMEAMKARMASQGGSRDTAREIFLRMYEQADDKTTKDMARRRLLQLDSLEIEDVLRRILNAYQSKVGKCPDSWREIEPVVRNFRINTDTNGAPLDPAVTPYLLVKENCDVGVDKSSDVPLK